MSKLNLKSAGNSKNDLIRLLEEVDQTSRSIKMSLTRLSSEPREGDPVGRERQSLIRKMKDKQEHLKTERELIKQKLAAVKENRKALNHIANNYTTSDGIEHLHAFMAAAVAILDDDTLREIETHAATILDSQ